MAWIPALTLGAMLFGLPTQGPERTTQALRTDKPVTIDGKADERIWADAPMAGGFQERTPALGEEPPYRTRFQVAYDDNNLYVFVRADIPRDKIRVRTLQRDSFGIFGDSSISIKLDPHHDRRSAINFAVNADGAQVDILVLEDGRVGIREWDAVWTAETTKRDDGYDVEFKIPFAILGIKGGDKVTMGLDVTRDEPTLNATYDWRVIVPPRHPVSASSFGTLTGLEDIHAQRALEITPYLASSTDFTKVFRIDPRRRANLAVGGDVRVQVGTGSYVEASVLTDFAQVEADQVQVASDRFPLFFPERRPFFINGLDVFNFGRPREAQLFFSRRIGLDGGLPIPLAGGVKAYGRYGPLSYGVLNVQTLRQLPHDDEFGEDEGTPPENFTVARVRMQTGRYASLGVIGAGKHRFSQPGNEAFSGGIDGEARGLGGKLRSYGFVASTWAQSPAQDAVVDDEGVVEELPTPQSQSTGNSAHALVEYQGLYVRPNVFWLWSDKNFEAPLGFYRRPGTALQSAEIRFAPRPQRLGLRDIQFGPRASLTTTPDYSDGLTRNLSSFVQFNWNTGWQANYRVAYIDDEVSDAFTLYARDVEAKRYRGFTHEARFETPGRALISGGTTYQYAARFGGVTHRFSGNIRLRANKHFGLEGRYTQLVGHLEDPNDTFNFGFLNGSMLVAINRNLIWDNLVRFSLEPEAERFGLQSRVRWRYRPGSDIFLVYRNDLPLGSAAMESDARNFHSLTLKATFYLRALLRS